MDEYSIIHHFSFLNQSYIQHEKAHVPAFVLSVLVGRKKAAKGFFVWVLGFTFVSWRWVHIGFRFPRDFSKKGPPAADVRPNPNETDTESGSDIDEEIDRDDSNLRAIGLEIRTKTEKLAENRLEVKKKNCPATQWI